MPQPHVIDALRVRFDELDKIGADPDGAVARTRGNDFENLLLDLFQAHNLLLRRSFHTADNKREQIDGAVHIDGRVALIEAKWTSESVAASELYAFLGKVEGKFIGTIGVFVSRTPLSTNFVGALRAGRRQSVIVIHGDDVPSLFRSDFELSSYLRHCIHHLSIDNEPHLSACSFLAIREQRNNSMISSRIDVIKKLLKQLESPEASKLVDALVRQKEEVELIEELTGLVQIFPTVLVDEPTNSPLRQNIPKYVASGSRELPSSETEADRTFLGRILPTILGQPDYLLIVRGFSSRLLHVSDSLRGRASSSLVQAWSRARGTFEDENRLVASTEELWPYMVAEAKHALLREFVDILNSYYHRPGFPQFELARTIVNSTENSAIRDELIVSSLHEEYEKLLREEDANDDKARAWAWKTVVRSYSNAKAYIPGFDAIITEARPIELKSTEQTI